MLKQLWALLRFLTHWSEQGRPSLTWLRHTSRKMNAAFAREHEADFARVSSDGEFQYVTVQEKIYVWPLHSAIQGFNEFLSELLQKQHPHHYDTAYTPITAQDAVLDIGACEGAFSALVAERGATVVAVEPSRSMSRVIRRLFEVRGLPTPLLANCLLGESPAEVPFVDDPKNPGSSGPVAFANAASYPVPMMTLDDCIARYLPNGVTFIKCDAEGWDPAILKSGQKSLAHYKPKIAVTTYHNTNDYRITAEFLTSLGYQCRGKGLLYYPHQGEYRTLMLHAVFPPDA